MATILITGGAGYIGSHCVLELMERHHVTVLDNLCRGHAELVPAGVELARLDLRDRLAVARFMEQHAFDAVIHLAGFAYVGESMAHPGIYFENNVGGSLNLLDAIIAARRRAAVIFSSSCAVYGVPRGLPITEEHPLAPVNPYGESKAMVERMLAWYAAAHGLRYVTLRYFNAAGADAAGRAGELHEPEPHVIPSLLAAARAGNAFEVYGDTHATADGTCVRDYVHVSDIASAHVAALAHVFSGKANLTVNLGTGAGLSVRQLIAQAESTLGTQIPIRALPARAGDPPALVADAGLAASLLDWKPVRSSPANLIATAWRWHDRARKAPLTASAAAS